MLSYVKKILEDMGWTDGYRMPVANKENIELEAEVERLTLAKARATLALEAVSSKCSALEKHLKHVKTEQEQNQTLLLARHSQLATEKDLYMLSRMEKDKTASEIKSFTKDLSDVESRKQAKLMDLNKIVSKMDKLKASIEWDEQAIDDWEDKLLKKHEDNDIIKKFSEEDKKKANDLEIKRQRLQQEFVARKQLVVKTSKELDSLKLILTRNVQLYKQMHDERSALVKQWQEAVKNLQQRDKDILAVNREIITTKELNEAKLELLQQEKQFNQNEMNNNAELQTQIEQGNYDVAKMRKDQQNNQQIIADYNTEYETIKRELKKTADVLQSERINTKNLFGDLLQMEKKLHNVCLKIQNLKVQEKNINESTLTAEERVRQLEQIVQNEETIHKTLLVDIENIQNVFFRSQTTLNDLENFHKLQALTVQGHEQGIQLLEKEKVQLSKALIKYKEDAYKIHFKYAMLMSKITRMEGNEHDGIDDATEENQKKLEELQIKCKEIMELSNLLQDQINRLEDVMRSLTNAITIDSDRLWKKKDKLQQQILLVDGAQKMLKTRKEVNHQYQVEENVLKVRLKHVEKKMKNEKASIYNLQHQQIELESMMKERESEIAIIRDLLNTKRVSLEEDNSRLRQDIQGRKMKIEMLKKRLDCIMSTLGKSDEGETVSVAYFKVKNAQEKYMLQEEGDKLDNMIRNAEKEIIAMENTLKAINISNDCVRKTLTLVEEQDDEIIHMKELESELHKQTKLLCQNRQQLTIQQAKIVEIQKIIDEKLERIAELQNEINEKEKEYDLIQNEAYHRKEKLQRTDKLIKRTERVKLNDVQKRDFITRQLQDFNRSALQQLSELSVKFLETKPNINHYLAENNLSLSQISLKSVSSKSYSSLSYTSSTNVSTASSIPVVSPELNIPK